MLDATSDVIEFTRFFFENEAISSGRCLRNHLNAHLGQHPMVNLASMIDAQVAGHGAHKQPITKIVNFLSFIDPMKLYVTGGFGYHRLKTTGK